MQTNYNILLRWLKFVLVSIIVLVVNNFCNNLKLYICPFLNSVH